MILFYLVYLLPVRKIRYYLGASASQVLFKLVKGKGGNFGQKWPKMAKNRENSMLFKMNSEENGKSNPKSDLIFGFTMKFYITYLPFFSTPLTSHI